MSDVLEGMEMFSDIEKVNTKLHEPTESKRSTKMYIGSKKR